MISNRPRIKPIACVAAIAFSSCLYFPAGRCLIDGDCADAHVCADGVCVADPHLVPVTVPSTSRVGPEGGDGVCDPPRAVFDPKRALLIGALSYRYAGRELVVGSPVAPASRIGRLDSGSAGFRVDPLDGRLVYVGYLRPGIFKFHPDLLEAQENHGCLDDWTAPEANPSLNDERVPTPGCPVDIDPTFFLRPDTAEAWYRCVDNPTGRFFDSTGAVVFDPGIEPRTLVAVGAHGLALARAAARLSLRKGLESPTIVTLPDDFGDLVLARTHGDGFTLVTLDGTGGARRWTLGADGVLVANGNYPAVPSVVEDDGTAYAFVGTPELGVTDVTRFRPDDPRIEKVDSVGDSLIVLLWPTFATGP